jgi:hypothetical protein
MLREDDDLDDRVGVGVDDTDPIVDHDVLVATPARDDDDDVLGDGDEVNMPGHHNADGDVDVDIDLGVRPMTGERLLDLRPLLTRQADRRPAGVFASFTSALAFG